jgi:hypothetical protein
MRAVVLLFLSAALCASAAQSQPISETVDGVQRICVYPTLGGLLSGQERVREYRVGLAQNCPLTYPVTDSRRPPPPTAALRSETVTGPRRLCTYEQWGGSWTFSVAAREACPPAAGMIGRSQGASGDTD